MVPPTRMGAEFSVGDFSTCKAVAVMLAPVTGLAAYTETRCPTARALVEGVDPNRVLNEGLMAGWSLDASKKVHAVAWKAQGAVMDLNALLPADSGWTLIEAKAVQADGSILGVGLKDGTRKMFRLKVE